MSVVPEPVPPVEPPGVSDVPPLVPEPRPAVEPVPAITPPEEPEPTLNRTGALSTEPTLFCTATEYWPTESAVTVKVSTAPVAPEIGRPSRRHWKVGAGWPLAATMKRTSASKGAD